MTQGMRLLSHFHGAVLKSNMIDTSGLSASMMHLDDKVGEGEGGAAGVITKFEAEGGDITVWMALW